MRRKFKPVQEGKRSREVELWEGVLHMRDCWCIIATRCELRLKKDCLLHALMFSNLMRESSQSTNLKRSTDKRLWRFKWISKIFSADNYRPSLYQAFRYKIWHLYLHNIFCAIADFSSLLTEQTL